MTTKSTVTELVFGFAKNFETLSPTLSLSEIKMTKLILYFKHLLHLMPNTVSIEYENPSQIKHFVFLNNRYFKYILTLDSILFFWETLIS